MIIQQTSYVCPRSAVGMASQAYVERIFPPVDCWLHQAPQSHDQDTRNAYTCHKL